MQTLEEKVFDFPAVAKGTNLGTKAALASDLEVYPRDCLVVVDVAIVLIPLFGQDRLRSALSHGLAPPLLVPETVFEATEAHVMVARIVFGFVVDFVDRFQPSRGMLVSEELALVGLGFLDRSDCFVVLLVDLVVFVVVIPAVVVFLGAHIVVRDGVSDSHLGVKSYPFDTAR